MRNFCRLGTGCDDLFISLERAKGTLFLFLFFCLLLLCSPSLLKFFGCSYLCSICICSEFDHHNPQNLYLCCAYFPNLCANPGSALQFGKNILDLLGITQGLCHLSNLDVENFVSSLALGK